MLMICVCQFVYGKVPRLFDQNADLHRGSCYIMQRCEYELDPSFVCEWVSEFSLFAFCHILFLPFHTLAFFSSNRTLTEYRLTNVTLDACDFDSTNTMAFQILLMMGVIFVVISAIVSVYIDRVDRKLLLSEFRQSHALTASFTIAVFVIFACFHHFTATWLLLASAVCLSIAFVRQFHVMVICFMIFLSVSLCAGIISAISVALFPTNYR